MPSDTPYRVRLEELFAHAAALPATDRAAWLDEACRDAPGLRTEVEELLRAHEAGGFMKGARPPDMEAEFARLKPEEVGERIGHYKLLEQIGEGGFGTVWVAEQEQPVRRRVALKIIKLGMDTREVIARFEQERQALAMMDHPHIAKVFDAGATQWGRPFFVMELVRGIKITDYCDQAKLPTAERLQLFISVCQAVQHAHQKGIIHRDLKPSNILVTLHDGVPVPKVIDFGVAKATQQQRLTDLTVYTQFEQMIGTPLYMSPEQAEMSGLDVDTRSDIYSLGVLLYELLTGRTPFDPEELMKAGLDEIRRTIREVEPVKPSTALQTLAAEARTAVARDRHVDAAKLTTLLRGDLDWIVMKALEKDRARRYGTATDLARDIERHLASEPVHARPASQLYRLRRLIKRNRLAFAASVAVALALVLGLAGTLWQAHRAEANADRAKINADAANKSAEEERKANLLAQAEAAKAKAQVREASRSDHATAQQRLADGKWQEAVAYLGRAIRYDPENRNAQEVLWLALRYGKRDAGRLPRHSLKHEKPVRSARFSPDMTRVLTVSTDDTARIWDAKNGQPIGAKMDAVKSASFSPDGARIVVTSQDGTARTWDATTGKPTGLALDGEVGSERFTRDGTRIDTAFRYNDWLESTRFSPDGARIVTASQNRAQIRDAKSGQPIGTAMEHKEWVRSAMFSPDGTRILTTGSRTWQIWDATTCQPVGAALGHNDNQLVDMDRATFSPDSSRIITTSNGIARFWNAKNGQPVGGALERNYAVDSAGFSPDGTRIITENGNTARLWHADFGQPVGGALEHNDAAGRPRFSPDGTRIVTRGRDGTVRIWDHATGQPIGAPVEWKPGFEKSSLSPDGTRIVTVSSDNTVRVWDATNGQPIGSAVKRERSVKIANFSPDGTRIVIVSSDDIAQVWDATNGQPTGAMLEHKGAVKRASFNPDSTRVVTASEDGTARIWDATSGQPIGGPLEHKATVVSASFSPDGTRVLTASEDRTARIWGATYGEPTSPALEHKAEVEGASFSPDGTRVVTASGGTAQIWDAKTGHAIGEPMRHKGPVFCANFSSDGTRVVTASGDWTAGIWDATTGQPLGAMLKHKYPVSGATFSPDGLRIVTVGDGEVQIWDAENGQTIGALEQRTSVESASFSPDGMRIITVDRTGINRIWDTTTDQSISAEIAESLTAFAAGARLDPQLGSLEPVSVEDRHQLWHKLEPVLASLPDWHFAARQTFPLDPKTALVSPRMSVTIRQAATSLLWPQDLDSMHDAAEIDPGHPLLPFAFARNLEAFKDPRAITPVHPAWLFAYGMKHLPADLSAADLRLAARFMVDVAWTLPEKKAAALTLLDRAAKLRPEDEETRKFRDRVK